MQIWDRGGLTDGFITQQPEAWTFSHAVLSSDSVAVEAKLFAASTLKGKVCYRNPARRLQEGGGC